MSLTLPLRCGGEESPPSLGLPQRGQNMALPQTAPLLWSPRPPQPAGLVEPSCLSGQEAAGAPEVPLAHRPLSHLWANSASELSSPSGAPVIGRLALRAVEVSRGVCRRLPEARLVLPLCSEDPGKTGPQTDRFPPSARSPETHRAPFPYRAPPSGAPSPTVQMSPLGGGRARLEGCLLLGAEGVPIDQEGGPAGLLFAL